MFVGRELECLALQNSEFLEGIVVRRDLDPYLIFWVSNCFRN